RRAVLRQPAALVFDDRLAGAQAVEAPRRGVEVLGRHEDLPEVAAARALVVSVAEKPLAGLVEADDPALIVDEQEDDRSGLHNGAREGLLALDLLEAGVQLALQRALLGEVANNRDDLVVSARHHARLEVAQLPTDLKPILDRLARSTFESPFRAVHQRPDDLYRKQVPDVPPDQLRGRPHEAARVALDVEVGAVPAKPDHQVRERVQERMAALVACPERLPATIFLE